jgi:hypothetical protein
LLEALHRAMSEQGFAARAVLIDRHQRLRALMSSESDGPSFGIGHQVGSSSAPGSRTKKAHPFSGCALTRAARGRSRPWHVLAVDKVATLERICELLDAAGSAPAAPQAIDALPLQPHVNAESVREAGHARLMKEKTGAVSGPPRRRRRPTLVLPLRRFYVANY